MELSELRGEIDRVDDQLLSLFLRRMALADEVAACKQAQNLPVRNEAREQEILTRVSRQAGDCGEAAKTLFSTLFALSRARQTARLADSAPCFGLVGRTLGHSWSVPIHRLLGCPDYRLFELEPADLPGFLRRPDVRGLNVTIPYKQTVLPLCGSQDDTVRLIGSANTLVRGADGELRAYNTDAAGFSYLARRTGLSFAGKNVLVLGSGGASLTAQAVARREGAQSVAVISRQGPDNYETLSRHADADILINATPVGMYPHAGVSPVDLRAFPVCRGVLDLVYNPRRTALLLQAEALGIPCSDGLPMLVRQAAEAEALFSGRTFSTADVEEICRTLRTEKTNLVLIGMPGCGKTTVGRLLAGLSGRQAVDMDEEIVRRAGKPIPEIFAQNGEAVFRRLEREVLTRWGQESGLILITGGGAVLDDANYPLLRQNGRIYHLEREPDRLARQGRPLSQGADLAAMYRRRLPLYQRFRDLAVDNNGTAEAAAAEIWRDFLAHSGIERPESEPAGNAGA